jgi:hypothetical protein
MKRSTCSNRGSVARALLFVYGTNTRQETGAPLLLSYRTSPRRSLDAADTSCRLTYRLFIKSQTGVSYYHSCIIISSLGSVNIYTSGIIWTLSSLAFITCSGAFQSLHNNNQRMDIWFQYKYKGLACYGALMMEAASISETSINFYQTTRRNNPEDSHLHTRRRENMKSHT